MFALIPTFKFSILVSTHVFCSRLWEFHYAGMVDLLLKATIMWPLFCPMGFWCIKATSLKWWFSQFSLHACLTMHRYFKGKLDIDHLDGFGSFHGLLWRNSNFTLTKKLLHKEGDVTASNRDVLYTTANDITLSLKRNRIDSSNEHRKFKKLRVTLIYKNAMINSRHLLDLLCEMHSKFHLTANHRQLMSLRKKHATCTNGTQNNVQIVTHLAKITSTWSPTKPCMRPDGAIDQPERHWPESNFD